MNWALVSLSLPLVTGLALLLTRLRGSGFLALATSLLSLAAACGALHDVLTEGASFLNLGAWNSPMAIRFHLMPLSATLLLFTALIHLLVGLYALVRQKEPKQSFGDFWPLSCLLHASLAAVWLSHDLFNWYVTLELLGLVSVALICLAGPKAYGAALRYLLLSLMASLCYLLGVALLYGRYGVMDVGLLATTAQADPSTQMALWLMSAGLMLKAALWPLHLWLPAAHASAPTPVSALLSALVVKAPIFILWFIWTHVAPEPLARQVGPSMALAGLAALLTGGWSAWRTPYLKTLVAYSTVAQLGYALVALGLLLHWQLPELHHALWLFVLAHGLAKTSMFLAAGELQTGLGRRLSAIRVSTQTLPLPMFGFAVAGGSLIGLPPSGGFLAKWVLLLPLLENPARWPWVLGLLLGTLASAAYVFRVISLGFGQIHTRPTTPADTNPHAQWLALVPALLVWAMALAGEPLQLWLGGPVE